MILYIVDRYKVSICHSRYVHTRPIDTEFIVYASREVIYVRSHENFREVCTMMRAKNVTRSTRSFALYIYIYPLSSMHSSKIVWINRRYVRRLINFRPTLDT